MKCMSQYLRIMSLKMRWPWIWATFGIQTKLCQYGAVFVETETGFDSVHLQSSIDTAQAGLGKQAFEHKMAKYEIWHRAYSDTLCWGCFPSLEWSGYVWIPKVAHIQGHLIFKLIILRYWLIHFIILHFLLVILIF